MQVIICSEHNNISNCIRQLVIDYIKPFHDAELAAIKPYELYHQIKTKTLSCDLVLLDMDMKEYTWAELATQFSHQSSLFPLLILVSAQLQLATEVYEIPHIYFILKTELEKRIPKALYKASTILNRNINSYLSLKYNGITFRILKDNLQYVEIIGRTSHLICTTQVFKVNMPLKDLYLLLSGLFVRCHSSYIVNLNYIQRLSRTECTLFNGIQIPVSRTYYKQIRSSYQIYLTKN